MVKSESLLWWDTIISQRSKVKSRCILVRKCLPWFWSGTDPSPGQESCWKSTAKDKPDMTDWVSHTSRLGHTQSCHCYVAPYMWLYCIRLQLMQSSQLFVACIQCWHARCMCVLLFSYNIIQLWCIQCDTIFTIRSHIRRLGWPQLRTPWHVEAGLLYSEHYYAKLWHSEASLNHTQDSEAYLGILCQLLAQFHKFTNCQCHPMAFTFQPYDSIQASRNKSQIVQT